MEEAKKSIKIKLETRTQNIPVIPLRTRQTGCSESKPRLVLESTLRWGYKRASLMLPHPKQETLATILA